MSGGLIIASGSILAEVQSGLDMAFEQASAAIVKDSGEDLRLTALSKELRKYDDLLDEQKQTPSLAQNTAQINRQNKLLEAFRVVAKDSCSAERNKEMVKLAKEIRKVEKDINKRAEKIKRRVDLSQPDA